MLIDARGIECPKPVLMAEEAVSKLEEGIVEILVDNEASVKNLTRFASKNSLFIETQKEEGHFRVKLVKGYPCEPAEPSPKAKGMFLVISTDIMGKDEALGKILMKGFLDTLLAMKEIPHTVFLLNAGVKLSATENDSLTALKNMEAAGAKIYSCGTCLKHYGIEGDLGIGEAGGMAVLIEAVGASDKTLWI